MSGSPSCSSSGLLLNYEGIAELQAFKGDIAAARVTFETGLRSKGCIGKATPRYLRQYALLEKRAGNYDAASELYSRAARSEPQDPKTWLQWGILERRRKRFQAAEDCFRRGVAAAPSHPHLWWVWEVWNSWMVKHLLFSRSACSLLTLCPMPLILSQVCLHHNAVEVGQD